MRKIEGWEWSYILGEFTLSAIPVIIAIFLWLCDGLVVACYPLLLVAMFAFYLGVNMMRGEK